MIQISNNEYAKLIAHYERLMLAARNTVNYYASVSPKRTCLVDELNPCGGIVHWGGGEFGACPLCSAKAALNI